MDWQPIETAPKDKPILAMITGASTPEWWWNELEKQPAVRCVVWRDRWHGNTDLQGWIQQGFDEEYGALLIATHWMPLPEPPND